MKKISIKITIVSILISLILPIFPTQVLASSITESTIFNLTNSERSTYSVAKVSWNYKLANAAKAKAQDMINKDYFSHNTPSGATPWTFITAAGYNYIYAGENLAMNFTAAEDVMVSWMNSGGHRANILSTNFKELGVGVVTGEYQGYTTTMVVQMFGTQASSVYTDNTEGESSPVKQSERPAPPPKIDYSATIDLSSKMIKKRIEDFKKAFTKLNDLIIDSG